MPDYIENYLTPEQWKALYMHWTGRDTMASRDAFYDGINAAIQCIARAQSNAPQLEDAKTEEDWVSHFQVMVVQGIPKEFVEGVSHD